MGLGAGTLLLLLPALLGSAAHDYNLFSLEETGTITAPEIPVQNPDRNPDSGTNRNTSADTSNANNSRETTVTASSQDTGQNTSLETEATRVLAALDDFLIEPMAAGLSSDLSSFITSVSMYDMNGNPVTPTTATYIGQTYKFQVTFAETTTLQLAYDTSLSPPALTYQLPPNLSIPTAVPQTPLYGNAPNNAIIGWYTIDTNGLVQMWFGNLDLNGNPTPGNINFIDYYANVNITFDVFAQLVGGSGNTIDFGNGTVVNIVAPTNPPPSLTMLKTSQYDPANEVINYTITITALGGSVSSISLADIPTLSSSTGSDLSFVGPTAYSGFTYMINSTMGPLTATPVWTPSPLSFSINSFEDAAGNPLVLASGDTLTLSYSLDIEYVLNNNNAASQPLAGQTPTNYSFTINNAATVEGEEADNGVALIPASDSTTDHVNRDLALQKAGVYDTTTDSITWTLTVGDGYSLQLNGGTITDTLSGGQALPPTSAITVSFYSSPSTQIWTGTANTFASFVENATGFVFDLPTAAPFAPIYMLTIEFDTSVPTPQAGIPGITYSNQLDFVAPDGTDGATTAQVIVAAPNVSITKTTAGICGTPVTPGPGPNGESYWIDYIITVDVPGGLQGQQLYLFDDLGIFPSGNTVTHVPQNLNVSITPSASEAGIALLNTGAVQMYGNSWRIFFGTDTPPPDNVTVPASTWQYNDPAVLTVTYRAYIADAYISILQSSPTVSLQNAVYLINCSNDPIGQQYPVISPSGNSVGGVNTVDHWPIYKTVLGTNNPAIFAYTVSINGGTRVPSLLQPGSAPLYADSFDSRMEYVPGTFYLHDSTADIYYAPANDVVLGASTNSFSIYLNSSDWQIISGTLPGASVVSPAPANWFATSHILQAHYELQLLPQYLGAEQSDLTNLANITVDTVLNACSFSNSVTTSYAPEVLQKTMTPLSEGADQVYVEIVINANGGYVFSDGVNPAPDLVTAVDLFQNLMIYTGTIQMFTQTEISPGVWGGDWTPVTPISFNDGTRWSVTVVPAAQVPAGYTGQIDFIIPNQTPVKVSYNALIDLPAGVQGVVSNQVSIFGVSDSDGNNQYLVSSQGVGVGAGRQTLRVFKRDTVGNSLGGAQFSLYVTDISQAYTPPGDLGNPLTDKVITGADGITLSFGRVIDDISGFAILTTDVGGVLAFSNEWINSSDSLLYLLVEESAPTGYYYTTPYTFFTMDPSITAVDVGNLNSLLTPVLLANQSVNRVSDFVNVVNYSIGPDAGTLRIIKEFLGLTDAQIQNYLQDFQLVVEGPSGDEFIFDLDAALDPSGVILQDIPAGSFTISERNASVPGYTLTTNPTLPFTTELTPNPAGEILIRITNTYAPNQGREPVTPVVPSPPTQPTPPGTPPTPGPATNIPETGPSTGDMLRMTNLLVLLLAALTAVASGTGLLREQKKAKASSLK